MGMQYLINKQIKIFRIFHQLVTKDFQNWRKFPLEKKLYWCIFFTFKIIFEKKFTNFLETGPQIVLHAFWNICVKRRRSRILKSFSGAEASIRRYSTKKIGKHIMYFIRIFLHKSSFFVTILQCTDCAYYYTPLRMYVSRHH